MTELEGTGCGGKLAGGKTFRALSPVAFAGAPTEGVSTDRKRLGAAGFPLRYHVATAAMIASEMSVRAVLFIAEGYSRPPRDCQVMKLSGDRGIPMARGEPSLSPISVILCALGG
jgi:hypothetical protein